MRRKLEGEDMSFEGIASRYLKDFFVDTSEGGDTKQLIEDYLFTGLYCPDILDEE